MRSQVRRALPAVLLIVLACASARTTLLLPGAAGTSVRRPIEILFAGDMRGKMEPCG
jgi:hypothetical protein